MTGEVDEYVLAGLIGVAMALIKLLEKSWDAVLAAKARANGDGPLYALQGLLGGIQREMTELKGIAAKQAEVSARQTAITEQQQRSLEKLERGQIRLLERSSDRGPTA